MTEASSPSLDQRLAQINQLIAQGEFEPALNQARGLLDLTVARQAARALQALAAAMLNQRDEALQALSELSSPEGVGKAEVLLATGSAWFKLGHPDRAIQFLDAAVIRQGEHPLARARLGACLLATGRVQDALPHLEKAVELMPKSGGAWLNLARARLATQQPELALAALDTASGMPDKEADIFAATRADTLVALGRRTEAVEQMRQAAEQGLTGATQGLVNLLCSLGEHDEAWRVLREELERQPEQLELLELAAEVAQVRGRFHEADRYLDQALKLQPDNAALWCRRAQIASRRLTPESARAAADRALELTRERGGPPYAVALAAHGQVLAEEERQEEAESAFREALSVESRCIPALSGLGHLLLQRGRVEDAVKVYEQLRTIAPLQGWGELIQARIVPDDPQVLEQMALAAHRPGLEGPVQTHMLFNLAAAWEKKKDYDKAWSFAAEANAASKEKLDYRPEVHRLRVEREMARFSRAFMESRSGWGDPSDLPVFVLGMPRSGTTLVEQILGSHSQVFGAGELSLVPELIQKLNAWELRLGSRREYPECVDDMSQDESRRFAQRHLAELQAYAPNARRIVDKLPHNFEHIGLIKLMFPNARILHLKREPRDVAMSNFFTDYSAKFGGMGFAYDLSWIGEQLVDHQRLMTHWHQVFPGQLLEVDYDSLVEDVEGWAHRIIDYLGLPWEDGVLSFQELDRAVKTASVWQVRQPVYTTSKAKWRKYEQHLDALEAAMAEMPPPPAPMPLPRMEPGLFLQGMAGLQGGRAGDAEACFQRLLQARPAHAAAHHFLGAALFQQGQLEAARKAMRRSLELQKNQPQWMSNLAQVEEALGNTKEAAELRDRVKGRGPVASAQG